MTCHFAAIAIAYIIDWIVGDPENWPHPVKCFGKWIGFMDRHLNLGQNRKQKGVWMVVIIAGIVLVISLAIVLFFYWVHPAAGMLAEAVMISTTVSAKGLKKAAMSVYHPLQQNDIGCARKKLSYIVGRDTDQLSEKEIIRAAVETVAENTSDGITAPFFWSFVGGAPLALVYRAVNTCDSMVGYQNDRYQDFGWASAKLDDLLNWIPARLTAVVMLFVKRPAESSFSRAWIILRRDARNHQSPNSGWGEAAVAAILGIQLGGTNYYQGRKSVSMTMGDAYTELDLCHIKQTITIMQRTVLLFLICLMMGGMLIELAITWI